MKEFAVTVALVIYAALEATANAGDENHLRTVLSCVLEDGSQVTLQAEPRGLEREALFIRAQGKTKPAFQDMPKSDFFGRIALAKCLDKTLVFALEYGSPYLKGVAIRQNPRTHADERVYFAEKAVPTRLYVSDAEMLVVIPNIGYETNKKYLVYRYVAGKGQQGESTPMDHLSVAKRQLIRIK